MHMLLFSVKIRSTEKCITCAKDQTYITHTRSYQSEKFQLAHKVSLDVYFWLGIN